MEETLFVSARNRKMILSWSSPQPKHYTEYSSLHRIFVGQCFIYQGQHRQASIDIVIFLVLQAYPESLLRGLWWFIDENVVLVSCWSSVLNTQTLALYVTVISETSATCLPEQLFSAVSNASNMPIPLVSFECQLAVRFVFCRDFVCLCISYFLLFYHT